MIFFKLKRKEVLIQCYRTCQHADDASGWLMRNVLRTIHILVVVTIFDGNEAVITDEHLKKSTNWLPIMYLMWMIWRILSECRVRLVCFISYTIHVSLTTTDLNSRVNIWRGNILDGTEEEEGQAWPTGVVDLEDTCRLRVEIGLGLRYIGLG